MMMSRSAAVRLAAWALLAALAAGQQAYQQDGGAPVVVSVAESQGLPTPSISQARARCAFWPPLRRRDAPTPPAVLPMPPPPCTERCNLTSITLLQIVTSGGPAYFYSPENATLGVSWLLPPAFNLTQAAAYPPATVKNGAGFRSRMHAQKRASDARSLASAPLQPPGQCLAQPAAQCPELLSVHIPHTKTP